MNSPLRNSRSILLPLAILLAAGPLEHPSHAQTANESESKACPARTTQSRTDCCANPRITSAIGMDRWFDLEWTSDGSAPGGTAIASSLDGSEFTTVEKVHPQDRKAPVFLDDDQRTKLGAEGKAAFRVSALDGSGKPCGWSEAVAVRPGAKRDLEAELRKRFDYPVQGRPYNNVEQVVIRHNRIVNPGACQVDGTFRDKPISELYAAICLDAVSDADVCDNEIVLGNDRCRRSVLLTPTCDAATIRVERNTERFTVPRR